MYHHNPHTPSFCHLSGLHCQSHCETGHPQVIYHPDRGQQMVLSLSAAQIAFELGGIRSKTEQWYGTENAFTKPHSSKMTTRSYAIL